MDAPWIDADHFSQCDVEFSCAIRCNSEMQPRSMKDEGTPN
jgi:hypothetical protein